MRFKILKHDFKWGIRGRSRRCALGVQTAVGGGAAGPKNASISFDQEPIFLPSAKALSQKQSAYFVRSGQKDRHGEGGWPKKFCPQNSKNAHFFCFQVFFPKLIRYI